MSRSAGVRARAAQKMGTEGRRRAGGPLGCGKSCICAARCRRGVSREPSSASEPRLPHEGSSRRGPRRDVSRAICGQRGSEAFVPPRAHIPATFRLIMTRTISAAAST